MISVIIISYNVKSYLRQCLKSIYFSKLESQIEIIVIDNDSFDHSSKMVENEFPAVKLLKNIQNIGFSKAVNQGVKIAQGDKICLVNPDALVENKTLDILYKYLNNNIDTGIVGAKVINLDGTTQLASKRSFPTLWVGISKLLGLNKLFPKSKIFGMYNETYVNDRKISEVDAVSGSCMMFNKVLFNKLKGFDESFFLYFEDTDFCARAIEIGYKVVYLPHAKIIHYKGESHKFAPFDTINVFHESMSIFFKKHSYRFKFWPLTWLLIQIGIGWHLWFSYIKQNYSKWSPIFLDISLIFTSFFLIIYNWYPYNYNEVFTLILFIKHLPLIFCYLIVWSITANSIKIYSSKLTSYGRSFAACMFTFFISTMFVYYISIIAYSRAVLFFSSLLCSIFLPGWRVITILMYKNRHSKHTQISPLFTRNIAILGIDIDSNKIGNKLLNSPSIDFNLVGYIEHGRRDKAVVEDSKIIGREEDLLGIIKKHKLNELIIPENIYTGNFLIQLIKSIKGENVLIKYVSSNENMLIGKGIVEEIGSMHLYELDIPLFERFNLVSKRVFDIIFSLILILITLPLQGLLYLTIPVNFKFIWGDKNIKLKINYFQTNNPIIRDILILYLVLKGDMSFVGCRQISIENIVPNLLFKPGMTGLGHLKSPDIRRDLSLFDQYYIQNQSFLFDLEILLKSMLKI